jgi:signal transduction histidine kinase
VLQTLALIQRHADEPREVARLARGQERELRTWLYRPEDRQQSKLAAALESVAGEVEDAYVVQVESVDVGDAEVDEHLGALVQATREALVNAAKHAGVGTISLYAEVEPEEVTVFVRDRGAGFDPELVDSDRHGVRGSIVGRMERHGGAATIRSTIGAGTEVELSMDRSNS